MSRREAGFTLLEMIVVLAIMAFAGTLVLLRQPWHSAGFDTEASTRAVVSAMRLARSRAIAQDRDVVLVTGDTSFAVGGGAPERLPAGEALSRSRVVFLPDGGASGPSVLLTAGTRRIAFSADWLTGRVTIQEIDAQ